MDNKLRIQKKTKKQGHAILPENDSKWNSLAGWLLSNLDGLSVHMKGSDQGPSLNVLPMTLPPINGGIMLLYLLAMLQPHGHLRILIFAVYHRQKVRMRVQEERSEIKPKQHTRDQEHAGSDQGAVCASCYPRCHGRVFINDVGDIASRSESIVRDRKKGHSCPAHTERERGRNRPQLPSICQGWA